MGTTPRIKGRDFLRVVVPDDRTAADLPTVTSVELYVSGLMVRWLDHPPTPDRFRRDTPRVSDDVGTSFTPSGAGALGNAEEVVHAQAAFTPGVPRDASRLTIEFLERAPVIVTLKPRAA